MMENLRQRKQKHLDICLDDNLDVETASSGFHHISLYHNPMPELDYNKISLETDFLGYRLRLPLLISSMTGGSDEGRELNRLLARTAREHGLAIGTGSIRVMLRHPETRSHFNLKDIAPDVPVLANIGIAQLTQYTPEKLIKAVQSINADGLFIHLNPAQELFQEDENQDFTGWYDGLQRLLEQAPFPVLVKETGFGIPPFAGLKMLKMGVAYVDVAGKGGTNWVAVEGYRLPEEQRQAADSFANWGYDTASLLLAYREIAHSPLPAESAQVKNRIIASGGLRSPSDFAISLACGAWLAGAAIPFIRLAARGGERAVSSYIQEIERGIRASMLLTSCARLSDFRSSPLRVREQLVNESKKLVEMHRAPA